MRINAEEARELLKACGLGSDLNPKQIKRKLQGLPSIQSEIDLEGLSKAQRKLLRSLCENLEAGGSVDVVEGEETSEENGEEVEVEVAVSAEENGEEVEVEVAEPKAKKGKKGGGVALKNPPKGAKASKKPLARGKKAPAEPEPVAEPKAKKGKKATAEVEEKPTKTRGARGVGVVTAIKEALSSATQKKPITREQILDRLCQQFPDRRREAMAHTVRGQINYHFPRQGFLVGRDEKGGFWHAK